MLGNRKSWFYRSVHLFSEDRRYFVVVCLVDSILGVRPARHQEATCARRSALFERVLCSGRPGVGRRQLRGVQSALEAGSDDRHADTVTEIGIDYRAKENLGVRICAFWTSFRLGLRLIRPRS